MNKPLIDRIHLLMSQLKSCEDELQEIINEEKAYYHRIDWLNAMTSSGRNVFNNINILVEVHNIIQNGIKSLSESNTNTTILICKECEIGMLQHSFHTLPVAYSWNRQRIGNSITWESVDVFICDSCNWYTVIEETDDPRPYMPGKLKVKPEFLTGYIPKDE